jgi:hypothetical protein
MTGFAKNPWVRYAGVFLAVAAINSNIPLLMAYQVRFQLKGDSAG